MSYSIAGAGQGVYMVYGSDHRLVGRITNQEGKGGGWFFRREDRKGDFEYKGRRVTHELHDTAALKEAIAAEMGS